MTLKEFLDRFAAEDSRTVIGEVYSQQRAYCTRWLLKQGQMKNVNDAKDIFADGVIILMNNAENGRIEPSNVQIQTYLTSICRNIQLNLHKRKDKASEYDLDELIGRVAEDNREFDLEKEDLLVRIEKTLALMPDPCASIFKSYYYEGYTHREIAKKQGYASESVSKSMMYKCKGGFAKLFAQLYQNS